MWLDKIESFQKNNKQLLDIKHELHLAIYVKELLSESIEFSLYENRDDSNGPKGDPLLIHVQETIGIKKIIRGNEKYIIEIEILFFPQTL